MSEYTKKPWVASAGFREHFITPESMSKPIASVFSGETHTKHDDGSETYTGQSANQIRANANLIAASPDMYEALEKLLNCISETRGSDAHEAVEFANKTLQKARGEG